MVKNVLNLWRLDLQILLSPLPLTSWAYAVKVVVLNPTLLENYRKITAKCMATHLFVFKGNMFWTPVVALIESGCY